MKKQATIASSIIVVLIILGGLVYWSLNKNHTFYNNENINENENVNNENANIDNLNTELDTSNWVTFEDKELGISYKHPADCWQNWAGPGTNYSVYVNCHSGIAMSYEKAINSFPNYDNGRKLSIKDIADIYYNLNENIPDVKILSDINRVDINSNEAYQFTVDSAFYMPCDDDYTKSCNGGVLYSKYKITFVGNGNNNMILDTEYNNSLDEKILETFNFTK
ncbi:hypothetical protein KKH39_00340 [Patescibacteria group bacterium]|nr:hypothetical protein [Patescibacteria group bacterium]